MKKCNGTCEACDCKNYNNQNTIPDKNNSNQNFNGIGSLSVFSPSPLERAGVRNGWGEVFNSKL